MDGLETSQKADGWLRVARQLGKPSKGAMDGATTQPTTLEDQTMLTLKISGTRGDMFYRPQNGQSILQAARIIRQHVGTVLEWARYSGPVGYPRAYDEAANRTPREERARWLAAERAAIERAAAARTVADIDGD